MNNNISVIIPVFNEQASIAEIIEETKKVLVSTKQQFELIVVNDASTDHTKEILTNQKDINVINNPINLGYGASLKKGIKQAKHDWILIIDGDATYPIKEIPNLIKHTNAYDMVVGARTGTNVHVPLLRKPAKWILTKLAQFLTRKHIPDLNSGLRIFKKEIALQFFHLFPSGFSFTTTITLACLTNDYTVKYVPIDYFKREGKSTIKPINDFVHFNKTIFKIVLYFEPTRFFLWPGFLLCLAGIAYGIFQISTSLPRDIGQFPFILFLFGIQLIFLGLIAELIVKSRK